MWVGTSGGVIRYNTRSDEYRLYDLRSAGLFGAIFIVDEPIYRFFCLGASAALLGATVMLLVLTKVLIWPSAIVLRR